MSDTLNTLSPTQAAANLGALFGMFGVPLAQIPRSEIIRAEEMPQPYRDLLAHENHMTVTLERHHAAPVNLTILKHAQHGDVYAREILLSNSKNGEVVLFGIMRFNFKHCSPEVRDKIIEGKTPLGRILIQNDILRRISTHALLKIIPNEGMMQCLGMARPAPVYGRLATIFCDNELAVDLLEVVPPKN